MTKLILAQMQVAITESQGLSTWKYNYVSINEVKYHDSWHY